MNPAIHVISPHCTLAVGCALAVIMFVAVAHGQGPAPTTQPSTTMAAGGGLRLEAAWNTSATELSITLTNTSDDPVKVDGDLIYGIEVSVRLGDGSDPAWEESKAPEGLKPLGSRLVDLAPGQKLTRVVPLCRGFEHFVYAVGTSRRGTLMVHSTTAYDARYRLLSNPEKISQIRVTYNTANGMLKDGFTYCVGKSVEQAGMSSTIIPPVAIACSDGFGPGPKQVPER